MAAFLYAGRFYGYSDNGGKALQAGDDGVVVSAGAMDDEQSSILVPSAHDPHANI